MVATTRSKGKVSSEEKSNGHSNGHSNGKSNGKTSKKIDSVAKVKEVPFGLSRFIHSIWAPLFLIVGTFISAPLVWIICYYYDGDLSKFATSFDLAHLIAIWPRPTFAAAQIVGWFALLEAVLMVAVPGKDFYGPVTPTGNRPYYKLNGVACYFLTHLILYVFSVHLGWFSPAIVYDHLGAILAFLSYFSFVVCFLLYFKGVFAPTNSDSGITGNFIMDWFWGVELHPHLFGFNLKQFANCRLGMMSWSVMIISYLFKQLELDGKVSNSMLLCVLIQVVYIVKFFYWEGGYFCTLDIMHDRFGYYIYWGVTVWVPSFYTLTALWMVKHPIEWDPVSFWAILGLGLFSIWANYDADAQRQRVRETNGACKVWGKKPATILAKYRTTDGEERENLLLVSGWWGIARHVHYIPELLLSLAWSLPAGFGFVMPYFYVIYLTILLTHRTGRDEVRCKDKYTTYWNQYKKRVPYRMIPYVY